MEPSDIHIRASSHEMPQPTITKIRLKITYLKFNSNSPRATELRTRQWNHHITGLLPGDVAGLWFHREESNEKSACWDSVVITSVFFLLSVRDVVAGWGITIVRTDAEEVYYFGYYDGQAYWTATQLIGSLCPRDLLAKGYHGQESYGAVSLGCDNNRTVETDSDPETAGNISIPDMSSISLKPILERLLSMS